MSHTCPFDGDHSPLKFHDNPVSPTSNFGDNLDAFNKGICPLCIHDFAGEGGEGVKVCIECNHSYMIEGDKILINPLLD